MPTTYELYTNENGTPKAVEGKAPAIVERMENLETNLATVRATAEAAFPSTGGNVSNNMTVQNKNVVRSVNNTTADTNGNVSISIPDEYTLPTATSSVLGGVKTGSNITNSSGTISLSKSNVTSALGYTPLQTAPVSSVNGKTGAVSVMEMANIGSQTYKQTTGYNGANGKTYYTTLTRDAYGRVAGFSSSTSQCQCDCDCTC